MWRHSLLLVVPLLGADGLCVRQPLPACYGYDRDVWIRSPHDVGLFAATLVENVLPTEPAERYAFAQFPMLGRGKDTVAVAVDAVGVPQLYVGHFSKPYRVDAFGDWIEDQGELPPELQLRVEA